MLKAEAKAIAWENWNGAIEAAAREAERIWKDAKDKTQQNKLSHGCLASADAIRELAVPDYPGRGAL